MSRIALVIDALVTPERAEAQSVASRGWLLGRALADAGHEVSFVHVGTKPLSSAADLTDAARTRGIRYVAAEAEPLAFDGPLFPSARSHVTAYQVLAVLRRLEVDACVSLDRPAALAIALAAKRTGLALTGTSCVVVPDTRPRDLARLTTDALPGGSRDAIIEDFFERRVLAEADWVVGADEALLDDLVQTGYVRANHKRAIEWPGERGGITGAWSELLAPAGAMAAPALPKVSVCMPYFEQPQFIAEALASLAEQTLAPFEVIVMDDGSRTPEAHAAYTAARAKYASRGWTFLRQENAGPAAARNRLAQAANGDAIVFCDADNRFRPEMLATLAGALARTRADAVTCAFHAFRTTAEASGNDRGYVFSPLGACGELALVENVLGDTNFIVRRQTFLALGGFPETNRSASEDWEFLLQLIRRDHRLEHVPAVLFDYRLSAGSHARRNRELTSAAAALAPVLAAAEPAWRRLWPHAVAALRNPRVPELEHQLEAARLQHQADLASLEQALTAARTQARRQRWELVVKQSALETADARTERVQAERDRAAVRIAELEQALGDAQRERDAAVAARDDKIRRMQKSWSWQATAPARALRRTFFDRPQNSPPDAQAMPEAGLAADHLRSAIDRPTFWDAAPPAGTIAGWCFAVGGQAVARVRASLDGVELPGRTGLVRDDVASAYALDDAKCGFEFHYRTTAGGQHQVRIEAQRPSGEWQLLHEGQLVATHQPRDAHDYSSWVECFGTVTPEKAAALRARLAEIPANARPLVSVLMPVHNPPERWLARAIESVREQIYENWELCIADDASTQPYVRALLARFQAEDPRIRVVYRPRNGHISAASNSALELVRGEFVALLDHDDEIPPDALAEVALSIAADSKVDLLYTDEDKIDEDGRRRTPYFKPDYLPDLLLGQNCLSHLSVYRTALVRSVGGFREGFEGSQDWDLALRVVDSTTSERVRHIPKVLYHWRAISGSTAVAIGEKSYSVDAARRALLDHFRRRKLAVTLHPVPGDHWQVVYPLPEIPPLVSIIIPTKNAARLLRTCVGSVFARTDYPRFELLIMNNRSDDPETLALFKELSAEENVRVIEHDAPFNFSAINNAAVRHARGSVLCFLNNDIEVITGRWLDEMVSHALRAEIGAVGAMLYYPNNTIQHAGVVLGLGGVANHAFLHFPHGAEGYMNRARLAQNYSAVTAACLVVRREVFEQVGGFNEADLAVAFNDIDLCLRIRAAGYRNLWTPFAELYHHESASRGRDDTPEHEARFGREIAYMRRTWGPLLDNDPAYNPNLGLNVLGWELAWPPRR